jgi:hypothetical protein
LWKSFRSKVLIARQLSLREWWILVEAWWVLFGFYLVLRWLSYDRLKTLLRLNYAEKADPARVLAIAQRLQKLVYLASRLHLLSMTCLPRAFTIRWMLGRRGIPAQLRIGMNKTSTGIHAHAWVEIDGQPIGESEDITERFKILGSMECKRTGSINEYPLCR